MAETETERGTCPVRRQACRALPATTRLAATVIGRPGVDTPVISLNRPVGDVDLAWFGVARPHAPSRTGSGPAPTHPRLINMRP